MLETRKREAFTCFSMQPCMYPQPSTLNLQPPNLNPQRRAGRPPDYLITYLGQELSANSKIEKDTVASKPHTPNPKPETRSQRSIRHHASNFKALEPSTLLSFASKMDEATLSCPKSATLTPNPYPLTTNI
jgi:hypothetical protein